MDESFTEHFSHSRGVTVELPALAARTDEGLSGPAGLHPAYDKRKSDRQIQRRYNGFGGQLKYTLPRLLRDASFLANVAQLRKLGWKDWHILQAVATVRLNYVVNAALARVANPAELEAASSSVFKRDEQETDPVVPSELLTLAELQRTLRFSQASTLKALGFVIPQRTPNFEGLNRFLERFNYWNDDIPHPQIFPE